MSHHDEYRQWPFLTDEEFELACAFFDQKYVQANLGATRRIFKIRTRRTVTTGVYSLTILTAISGLTGRENIFSSPADTKSKLSIGVSYVEIIRLLELPEDEDELSKALGKLTGSDGPRTVSSEMEIDPTDEDADKVCKPLFAHDFVRS
jgi:ubiquitin-like-conjugating enzyme ATG10